MRWLCWSEGERAGLVPALVAEPAEGGLVGPLGLGVGFSRWRNVVSLVEPFEGGSSRGESVGGVFRGERMPGELRGELRVQPCVLAAAVGDGAGAPSRGIRFWRLLRMLLVLRVRGGDGAVVQIALESRFFGVAPSDAGAGVVFFRVLRLGIPGG